MPAKEGQEEELREKNRENATHYFRDDTHFAGQ